MLARQAEAVLFEKSTQYPIIAITGPRQSGKSTLAKKVFPNKPYLSFEDLDQRQFATEDPRRFLAQLPDGAVLDECQHCPALFSYLQTHVDQKMQMGQFILTGSRHFGLMSNVTQSLAGRVGFIQLLPFTLKELQIGNVAPTQLDDFLFTGTYPPIYHRHIPPSSWYSDYIMTYIERDVRQVLNIQDLNTFHRFLRMCAARTGQLLNLSGLAADCGITHNTAKAWLSVLEASYIIFLLQPHYRNFNKRLTKSPKLYFYDAGLACTLLGIQSSNQISTHSLRGALFETLIVSELMKNRLNRGLLANIYFWRDSAGHEIDVLIENGETLIPIEIKSGQTIVPDYFIALRYWETLSGNQEKAYLIYGGDHDQDRDRIHVLGWKSIDVINQ